MKRRGENSNAHHAVRAADIEGYTVDDSNSMTSWERHNSTDQQSPWVRGAMREEEVEHGGPWGRETTLHVMLSSWWMYVPQAPQH